MRLDQSLAQFGLSREKAKAAVLAGLVTVNGREERKPSRDISDGDTLALKDDETLRYVGRGALKLLRALDVYEIAVAGLRCLDVGASTGGFTQVLLERGAARVFAVDVGAGQLAGPLRDDARVANLERTDIRALELEPVDFICADVSFISLRLILPKLFDLLKDGGAAVCLLKPQFECGPGHAKHGIVKDPKVQARAVGEVCAAARGAGFALRGVTHSPITGGDGNLEFLLFLRRGGPDIGPIDAAGTVRAAREALGLSSN